MITLTDLKNFDLKQLDPTKIDLSRLDLRKVELPELPKIDMPKIDMPKIDMPKFELPKIDMPVDVDRMTAFARDAAYVGVGAVVVTAQKVDERRREVAEQVTTQIRKIVDAVA